MESEPASVYWRVIEKGPNVTADVTWYQKPAYGISEQKLISKNKVRLRLRALSSRTIEVELTKVSGACRAVTYASINKKRSQLDEIYVFAKEGLIKPEVIYIDIKGKDLSGSPVKERIRP